MICCDFDHIFGLLFSDFFFFFKQKTAYEMRISDWSSDVCSSDLSAGRTSTNSPVVGGWFGRSVRRNIRSRQAPRNAGSSSAARPISRAVQHTEDHDPFPIQRIDDDVRQSRDHQLARAASAPRPAALRVRCQRRNQTENAARSEAHTYELQSLMRN